MSTVWQTQHRLFSELFQNLAEWLSSDAPRAPAVLEERMARLLAVVVILMRQHHVNKRGQCRICGWTRWKWRFWCRRRRCTVHQASDFAMNQSLDVVWWCVFESAELNLSEIRTWLAGRMADTCSTIAPVDTIQGDIQK